jgi:hypothetical protein
MRTSSEENLTVEILSHMLEHPDALDEAEGILAWWFSEERVRIGVRTLEKILQDLVEQDLILARNIPGDRVVYSLNKSRKEDIARFIRTKKH